MKIYTKNGDKGNTKLLYGGSVSKDNFEPEAVGTVDELVASLKVKGTLDQLLNQLHYSQPWNQVQGLH